MKRIPTFDITTDYHQFHQQLPSQQTAPMIGLTGNYNDSNCTLAEGYYQSILQAGGIPVIIPPYDDTHLLAQTLDQLDGILLTGGGDINPLYLGEEPIRELHGINPRRDRQELLLTRLAADRQLPILGICRGVQVMNAAFDGALYQDIHVQMEGIRIKHSQDLDRSHASHTVQIEPGTLLHNLFKSETLAVNSFHHQAAKDMGEGMRATAFSDDGIVEAIEHESLPIWAVQFHPERLSGPDRKVGTEAVARETTPDFSPLFEDFVKALK